MTPDQQSLRDELEAKVARLQEQMDDLAREKRMMNSERKKLLKRIEEIGSGQTVFEYSVVANDRRSWPKKGSRDD